MRQVFTSASHHSSNEVAERCVQTLKNALRKGLATSSMERTLSKFVMVHRNISHVTTQETSYFLFLCGQPRTRLDTLKPLYERSVRARSFSQLTRQSGANVVFQVNNDAFVHNFKGGPR